MRIGDLAARTGVSVRSLRYYEEQGLLRSVRNPGGQRQYGEDAVERVAFVQRMYAAGLSSSTVAELLPCVERPSTAHSEESLRRLAEERERLADRVDDLTRTLATLDAVVAGTREYQEAQRAAVAAGQPQPTGDAEHLCHHVDVESTPRRPALARRV